MIWLIPILWVQRARIHRTGITDRSAAPPGVSSSDRDCRIGTGCGPGAIGRCRDRNRAQPEPAGFEENFLARVQAYTAGYDHEFRFIPLGTAWAGR